MRAWPIISARTRTHGCDICVTACIAHRMEQRSSQRRVQWKKLCEGAGVGRDPRFARENSVTSEQFCVGLRALGVLGP